MNALGQTWFAPANRRWWWISGGLMVAAILLALGPPATLANEVRTRSLAIREQLASVDALDRDAAPVGAERDARAAQWLEEWTYATEGVRSGREGDLIRATARIVDGLALQGISVKPSLQPAGEAWVLRATKGDQQLDVVPHTIALGFGLAPEQVIPTLVALTWTYHPIRVRRVAIERKGSALRAEFELVLFAREKPS